MIPINYKRFFLGLAYILLFTPVNFAQNLLIDSLKNSLNQTKNDAVRIELLNELSWEFAAIDYNLSVDYAAKAMVLSRDRFPAQLATSYNRLGYANDLHGNYNQAIDFYEKSFQLRLELEDSLGVANVLINIGASYYYRGIYSKALEYYLNASTIQQQIGDKKGLSKTINNVSLIYRVKNDFSKALHYLNLSLQLKKEINDQTGVLYSLSNLGIIYQNMGDCKKAISYADSSYQLAIQLNSTYDIGTSITNIGEAYRCDGNYKKAIEYFDQAEQFLLKSDDLNTLAFCYKGKAESYIKINKNDIALDYLKKSNEIAIKIGRRELISENYLSLYLIYKEQLNFQEALFHFEKYLTYKDSLFTIENERAISEMEAVYEKDKKDQQIIALNQEAEIKESQAINDQLIKKLLIVIIVGITIITILFWINLRQKKNNNLFLSSQNRIIRDSLIEKEILLREVHHRVKNNLQIISGLIELQEGGSNNSLVNQEIQGRIKSMALIHEMLYQSENISMINTKKYFERLIETIEMGYADHKKYIQKVLDIDHNDFNIDTIIPIGLIINELVNNSFKYAFLTANTGILTLKLKQRDSDFWELIIHDNGPGFNESQNSNSFGLKLVKMLCRQLKGQFKY